VGWWGGGNGWVNGGDGGNGWVNGGDGDGWFWNGWGDGVMGSKN